MISAALYRTIVSLRRKGRTWAEIMREGSTAFNVGQACKKSLESVRLPKEKAVAEILGAINYLAGAVLILEDKACD